MNQSTNKKSTMRKANIFIALIFAVFATTRIVRILGIRIVRSENGIEVRLHPHFNDSGDTSPLEIKNKD